MINFDNALGIHAQTALLRSRRAEIIAGNLANADTPGFQARDFDFSAALANATGEGDDGAALRTTSAGHLGVGADTADGIALEYRLPTQASLDQNSVDVQGERSRFLDNAMRYEATMRFIDSRLSGLLRAFRGD